ncbi:MAG: hypothetical protein AB7Y74_00825 [Syntrophorhabdus sp.]
MVTIIDAVMGTGKSTAMFTRLNTELSQKFIILTLLRIEVKRYNEEISSAFSGKRPDVEALEEQTSISMKQRFLDAVRAGKTVITTHALFADLNEWDLAGLTNINEYSLIIDETITLVDPKGLLDGDLQDLVDLSCVEPVNYQNIKGLEYYKLLPKGKEIIDRKKGALYNILNSVSGQHVYKVDKANVLFIVPPEMLTAFKDVTIMTYMFLESETHAWLELFRLKYQHFNLVRTGRASHDQIKHNGTYNGNQFKNHLTIYDHEINEIGLMKLRRKGATPLTMRWYNRKSTTQKEDIAKLSNNLRTFFRHIKINYAADKSDMMWTCPSDFKDKLRHSEFDDKVEDSDGHRKNWVPFNQKATNKFKNRHYLAYPMNVYPRQDVVEFFKMHKVPFSRDRFGLSTLLQWVWRSAIREEGNVILYLPSPRMRALLEDWLMSPLLKMLSPKP